MGIESYVVVHNIAKRHNVGTLARNATAFGVAELILVGRRDFNSFGGHGCSRFLGFHPIKGTVSRFPQIWFAFSWLLDVLPKFNPINRATDLAALRDKFERVSPANPSGRSDLPCVDIFVSAPDPDKEPPLVTANPKN